MPLFIVSNDGHTVTPYRFIGDNPPGIAIWSKTASSALLRAPIWHETHRPTGQYKEPIIPSVALQSATSATPTLPRGELGKIAERIASLCQGLLDRYRGAKYIRVPRDTMVELFQLSDELESKLDGKE